MKMQIINKTILICILMTLIGCSNNNSQTPTEIVSINSSPTGIKQEVAPESTPIIIASPTLSISLIPTFTLVKTIQAQPTSTWTPRPTLPPEEAQKLAFQLVSSNGNCQLPCWLGITPGITNWDEARSFLATFAEQINSIDVNTYGIVFSFPQNAPYKKSGATIYIKNNLVESVATVENIKLSDLLTTYGAPSEIKIRAIGRNTQEVEGKFTLVLFYSNRGLLAVYDGKNEKAQTIHICPNKIQGPQRIWFLWDPKKQMTFSDAGGKILLFTNPPPPSEQDYVSLEKITNMDVNSFYQKYHFSENDGVCFEMKAPDWP